MSDVLKELFDFYFDNAPSGLLKESNLQRYRAALYAENLYAKMNLQKA